MDTVLVTGGTGHLGRDIVARLKGSYRVRVLARSAESDPDVERIHGDLATGEGIAEGLAGSQIVIHAATLSPAARRGFFAPRTCGPARARSIAMVRPGCWIWPPRPASATFSTSQSSASTGRGSHTCAVSSRPNISSVRGRSPGRSPERPSSTGCLTGCSARWLGCRSCRYLTCRWSRWIRPTSLTTSSSPSAMDRQAGWLTLAARKS